MADISLLFDFGPFTFRNIAHGEKRSYIKKVHFPLIQNPKPILKKGCDYLILTGLKNNSLMDLSPAFELQVNPIKKVKKNDSWKHQMIQQKM